MTRVRVLMKAIELLRSGFVPFERKGLATNSVGEWVADVHPDVKNVTGIGAITRAIYLLTGDHCSKRADLWSASMDGFQKKYTTWTAFYDFIEHASQEQIISLYEEQLREWER